MALIGEMHYLTIGGNTYSIPISGGSTVTVTRSLTSGTKSATISVDGTSYDLYAPTPNAGTVTSVRVQATSPVQSSTSTAQSSSLNTTISLKDAYGDTKNPYGTKTANYVLAGPTSGSAAAPSFRALVAADIPDLSGTYLTSYTETDPVFSASAASGIESTDITNWNSKTSNTGTITQVTAGTGLKIGSATSGGNITTSGTINHINSVTAQTTQAIYPIKIDAQGHISAYGTAVTSMPASDVYTWAKASTKPSYTFSEIGSKPTTLSGYGITDAYTKTQVDGLVAGVLHYKGTKTTVSALPTSGNTTGDVWHVTADGSEWAWDGSAWQELGTAIDLSGYAQLAGASFTGPVTFGDSVSIDEATVGDLVVNGAASFTNNLQANTINGVAVGSSPKFTDTVTTITTTGSGNAITEISATNGAITATKGATYVTSSGVTSITLTQGTGISIGSSGTAITTTGSRTISLATITKSDTTSTASPSHGGTFTAIDSITYDTYGRVTGVNTKTVTLPADSNTDTKVTQAYSTANNSYPVLFSATAGVSSTSSRGATTAILNNAIYANPSTGNLHVTQLNGVTVGDSPKFTDTTYTNVSEFTNDAGYITSADVPEGASAYTGTISAVGTSASSGTNNGFARGDHVHNITSSTITSALGYTPYNSTNPNGYISSYTDEKLKWTASTSSNTYYPLQSTSTATTSTANTLNGISFYQYYNTAGGYRRLILGNSTAYTSTGGAYGTIRLYGTGATYYGDLNPGTLGANRTWTLPNATGTIALTSDIPDVSSFITDAGVTKITTTAGTHSAITNATGAVSFNVPTKTSHLTNDSNFVTSSGVTSITLKAGGGISLDTDNTAITTTGTRTISHADTSSQASSSNSGRTYIQSITLDTYGHVTGISTATESVTNTDSKLTVAAVTSGTQYYPVVADGANAQKERQVDTTGFTYKGTNGTTSAVGSSILVLGNSTGSGTANNKQAQLIMYGSNTKKATITLAAPSADIALALPTSSGTLALTSQIPTISYPVTSVNSKTGAVSLTASDVGALASSTTYVSTVTTTAGTHSAISSKSGAVSFNVPTKTSHLTNDSGFITASHTSTYSLPLAASGTRGGIQVGYSTSGKNYAVQLSSEKAYVNVPWTDTKVELSDALENSSYNVLLGADSTAATRQYDSAGGFKYKVYHIGSDTTARYSELTLGNNITAGTADSRAGVLYMYNTKTYAVALSSSPSLTAHREISLPDESGSVLLGKLGYTTSGNNRAIQKDSSGNLYVVQKDDDTKNTAGSTDTSSKIFLIGATSQAANPQTYSHDTAYVGTDGCLYSGGAKVLTAHQTAVTSLTTTAGVHTTKTSATGAVSMAIPTKTSHLTNDSGFLTSNNVTDYIIEQGTSGIWTYRKWNSGIAECWGSVATTTALTTWVNPISYGSTYCARQTFPTGLFTAVPKEFVSLSSGTDSWLCSDSTNKVTATQTGRYYIARPSSPSGNFTFTVYFHEIGNWK